MMEEHGEGKGGKHVLVVNTGMHILKGGDVNFLVTTVQVSGKDPTTMTHLVTTETVEIAKAITTTTGFDLQPEYFEVVKETVERSKGLSAGIKLGVNILGCFKFEIEKKPQKETRTIQKAIYRKP